MEFRTAQHVFRGPELSTENVVGFLSVEKQTKRAHRLDRKRSDSNLHPLQVLFGIGSRQMDEATGRTWQRSALAFTVDVCFQLKNRQTEPTSRTCSDINLLALQVFSRVAEETSGGATGCACDDNNPHSLQLRWKLPSRQTGGGSYIL